MDEQNPQAMILDALKQMGVPQEKVNMPGVANLVNQYRLSTGKLQPGQAERVARLGVGKQEAPYKEPGLGESALEGAKELGLMVPRAIKGMAEGAGEMLGTGAAGIYTGITAPPQGPEGQRARAQVLSDELLNSAQKLNPLAALKAPYNVVKQGQDPTQPPVTPGQAAGAFGGAAALLGGGIKGGLKDLVNPGETGGIDPAAARAAQLASDLKWNKDVQTTGAGGGSVDVPGLVRGVGNTPTYARRGGTIENVPFAPEQSALRLNQGAPAPAGPTVGLTPKFEEDAMPRAYEPTPASPYPAAGGYHPELEQLFKDVLNPAKEEAPQQGAGFQALKQTRRAKARLGSYRQSEDDTGGQPS